MRWCFLRHIQSWLTSSLLTSIHIFLVKSTLFCLSVYSLWFVYLSHLRCYYAVYIQSYFLLSASAYPWLLPLFLFCCCCCHFPVCLPDFLPSVFRGRGEKSVCVRALFPSTHTQVHLHTHTLTRPRWHTDTHTQTLTYTLTHTHTHTHTLTHTHSRTHTRTHLHTHTEAHAHTIRHTFTHTHTHY